MLHHAYSICDIHNNIVHKVSEGMQEISWMTSKEHITIKQAIKCAITWAHKAWVKFMQLGTSAISATWSHHKDVLKPEVKPCQRKYYQ